MATGPGDVTQLLVDAGRGDQDAMARVADLVYDELRALAGRVRQHRGAPDTCSTTALVHEAYAKLAGSEHVSWQGRSHFLGVAAKAMRSILVDYVRARGARKRGGDHARLPLDDVLATLERDRIDVLGLDEALGRLEAVDPRKARVVELRFFGGLSIEDTARMLDVSTPTVERDWQFARTWLHRELTGEGGS